MLGIDEGILSIEDWLRDRVMGTRCGSVNVMGKSMKECVCVGVEGEVRDCVTGRMIVYRCRVCFCLVVSTKGPSG